MSEPRRRVSLTLPEPPSANRYWRHARGRTYLSAEARTYRLAVRAAYVTQTRSLRVAFPADPVRIVLAWYRGRKAGDLDNRIKQALDALRGLAYTDDAQIVRIVAERHEAPRQGRLDVELYAA